MKKFLKPILNYFFQGLLFIAPIGITGYILYFSFTFIDNLLPLHIPGLGITIIFCFITLLGFVGKSILAKPVFRLFEMLIEKMPFVEMLYSSIRDFLEAFVGKEKKFTRPVLVKINRQVNLEKIGFITEDDLSRFKIEGKVAVYFPHSYNFSGELFIVPKEDITPIDIPSSDIMKFVVSGGITKID